MDQHDPSVSELLPLMRAASTSPEGPKWSRKGSADSDEEWGPSQFVKHSQRPRNCTPIDSGSESDFRPVVKEEIKIEVTSPRVERPSSPSVSDDDPLSDRALHSLVKEEKYRPRSLSPSEDFIGFTEVDRDSACFISNAKRSLLLGCSSAIRDSTEVFAEGVFIKSQRLVINYRDVDGLDDSNIFCDVCCRDWDGECPVHGPLKIIHDTKARPGIGDVDRDVKTLPPSLSSGPSTNPASGTGISGSVQCPHCDFRCLGQQHLDRHVKRSHGHIGRNGRFKCEWCQYSTDKSRNMKHHRRTHTGERPHRCDVCTARFTQRSHLTAHMLTHTGVQPYGCSICMARFTRRSTLNTHMRTHTGERPHGCSICTARFTTRSNLINHMRTHTGERPYGCSICKARFTQRSYLITHMRTHTGERPFGCSICTARFTDRSGFNKHMRTHTAAAAFCEQPHCCSICKARFTRRSHLNTHMLTHSGERPFSCSVCLSRFTRRSTLNIHMRSHTGERPYGCSRCQARFALRGNLSKHMRTHTGERPYGCSHCQARFAQRGNLTKHMQTHAKSGCTAATTI